MTIRLILIVLAFALLAYVRLAPSDPARWHIDPQTADDPAPGGVKRAVSMSLQAPEALEAFHSIASTAPRTSLLAGTIDEGRLTYVTRSRWVGFPDYVSVSATPDDGGSTLHMLSRLRFGLSDMGANAKRLDGWLQDLQTSQN